MTFFGALYNLFIGPLELFFETVFVISNRLIGNLGLSIIVLSLVMNFLVFPLYRRADAMQEEQRETEKKLKKWVTHIKKSFKGDERFMMLQTYYRQNNYKPSSILKGSVSLLLEIPFFIAAYNFLSHAGVFNGFSFGPFADMGQPDGLIKIGTFSINLLPILMTAINIVSSMIYTKDLPVSSKVQLYGMAGIFLVLLYNSPAALVFYWTLNNLFSLLKNLFYKLKNPKFVFGILASCVGVLALIFELIHPFDTFKKNFFVIAVGLFLQLPLIWYFAKRHFKGTKPITITKNDTAVFYLSSVLLAILTGALIPSALINSSPEEFINQVLLRNPLLYVLNSILLASGTFIIWFMIFYKLSNNFGKKSLSLITCIVSISSIINYMFFGRKLGIFSNNLRLGTDLIFSKKEIFINLFVLVLVFAIIILLWLKKDKIFKYVTLILVFCTGIMSIYNSINIGKITSKKIASLKLQDKDEISIPLSKNGKNVIVIMMDRAINGYIPYIFNEKPELKEKFDGFVYYPNTISYGGNTNFGSPALYGGYEYTPKEINKRDSESLASKQNEALKVMPVIFDSNDFDVTVCDPTYAGYDAVPDLTIYDEYPDIRKFITMGNVGISSENEELKTQKTFCRNLFAYGVFKIFPVVIQPTIYNEGNYNSIESIGQIVEGLYRANGTFSTFLESYSVLKNLPSITKIKSDNINKFLMISNDTTHSPCLLQEPEYEPAKVVDNTEYERKHADRFILNGRKLKMETLQQIQHYEVNMAAMIQLGNYFDFLRENDVYDNTRIIIVADHGNENNQFDDMIIGDEWDDDTMRYNPLLMVKDFNSVGFSTDNGFMTNGDVPSIAFKDLIDNPVNPFTGKNINNDPKFADRQYIILSKEFNIYINNGNKFLPSSWYAVHDNIFDKNNWEKIE